jgi:hypothetical protein
MSERVIATLVLCAVGLVLIIVTFLVFRGTPGP